MSEKRWLVRGGDIRPVLVTGKKPGGFRSCLTAGGTVLNAKPSDLHETWGEARESLVNKHRNSMLRYEAELSRAREAKRSAEQMKRRPWPVGFGEELEKAQ